MIVMHNIEMDLAEIGITKRIFAVQGDSNTRAVEIALAYGNKPWAIPEGVVGMVRFHKPDGTGGIYDTLPDGTAAVTAKDNVLTAILAPQMLTAAGDVDAQVELISGSDHLATFTFRIAVQADPSVGAEASKDYVNLSEWLASALTEAKASGEFNGPPGPQGPQGGEGPKGDPGVSGVHIGPDAPPETANIWINPNGEPTGMEDWEFDLEDGSTDTKRVVVIDEENSDGRLAVLKFRRADGTWADIPAIVGAPGKAPEKGVDYFDGQDGITPHIGANGNWYLGDTDTGVRAAGSKGDTGKGIQSITRTAGTGEAGSTDTYTITYTDGSTGAYTVVNGKNGTDGTSVTIASVTESAEDGGSNVVIFSDGKTLTVKNGKTGSKGDSGYTPVKGTDYFDGKNGDNGVSATHSWNGTTLTITSASGTSSADLKGDKGDKGDSVKGDKGDPYTLTDTDKNAIAAAVKASLPTENWIFTLEDGSTVTKAVYVG